MVTLPITMDVPQCVQHKVVTLHVAAQDMRYRELVENVRVFVEIIFWSNRNNAKTVTWLISMDAHQPVESKDAKRPATARDITSQDLMEPAKQFAATVLRPGTKTVMMAIWYLGMGAMSCVRLNTSGWMGFLFIHKTRRFTLRWFCF